MHLDLNGVIPTAADTRAFLDDGRSDKRARLIDQLLARPEYALHMARVFDVMLIERRLPAVKSYDVAAAAWRTYLAEAFAANKPWDALVREVLATIASGQTLDLERFAGASRENPVVLDDDAALEDYAWRVAGCVGAFWTKLGFLTLGDRFSKSPEPELLAQGIAYGKGLQLVNILRDLAADLATDDE